MTPAAIAGEAKAAGLPSSIALPTCSVAKLADRQRQPRPVLRRLHAHPRPRGDRRPDVLADGALRQRRRQGHQRRRRRPKSPSGKPLDNPARAIWISETALGTALNTSLHGRADGAVRDRRRHRPAALGASASRSSRSAGRSAIAKPCSRTPAPAPRLRRPRRSRKTLAPRGRPSGRPRFVVLSAGSRRAPRGGSWWVNLAARRRTWRRGARRASGARLRSAFPREETTLHQLDEHEVARDHPDQDPEERQRQRGEPQGSASGVNGSAAPRTPHRDGEDDHRAARPAAEERDAPRADHEHIVAAATPRPRCRPTRP